VLAYAAAAERLSEHPLARAVCRAAAEQGLLVPADSGTAAFEAVSGKGIAARVPRLSGARLPVGAGAAVMARDAAASPPLVSSDVAARAAPAAGASPEPGPEIARVVVGRPEFLAERGIDWTGEAAAALDRVAASGETPVCVAVDGQVAGVIGIADSPRPEAAAAIAALRSAGLRRIVLLTGDRAGAAHAVAQAVGIAPEDVHAGLLPEEKVAWVRRLKQAGHRVAMVGDGVNDAPALAAADVAIAMGAAGTDLAMASADVVLMTDDLRQAASSIVLSRKTLSTIRQNLVFAALWNVAAVMAAASGVFGPVAGALIHNLGSVAVVVNAARLVGARIHSREA
jgi:Cd2+/Zn2+-exporting ATPase